MRAILLLLLPSFVFAQQVIRGPYLQVKTDQSIEICWRTDVATNSVINYGTSASSLSQQVVDNNAVTDHFITISALTANTKYYYSVGTTQQILSTASNQHFTTAPAPGTVGPYRFWVIGDFGKGNQGQRDVMNSFLGYSANKDVDLMVMLGDNAYSDGTQTEYQNNLFNIYDSILPYIPVVSTPGNHDYNSVNRFSDPTQHTGPYYDIFNSPITGQMGGVASNTELYYSFDYGNIHFVCLNSELQSYTNSSSSPMFNWLRSDLQANTKEWTVCYFHQPPYSKGSHNSDDFWELLMLAMRQNALPILEQYDVDLVLCGHSHVYERSKLIKGHYGYSFSFNNNTHTVSNNSGNFSQGQHYTKYLNGTNDGTIYVVCGNSGSSESGSSLNHPVMVASDGGSSAYGSLLLEVNGNRLDGKYIKSNGVIDDEFTIIKPDGSTPVNTSVTIEANEWQTAKLYPNPSDDRINVDFSLPKQSKIRWSVYDINGKVLLKGQKSFDKGNQILELDTDTIPNGAYILRLQNQEQQISLPFVKQKNN
jgi:predicted phosphodiesterase